jgi:hypothetical protein
VSIFNSNDRETGRPLAYIPEYRPYSFFTGCISNSSFLNRIALNLLKNGKTAKVEVRGKRLKAEWDNRYLCKPLKI